MKKEKKPKMIKRDLSCIFDEDTYEGRLRAFYALIEFSEKLQKKKKEK